MCNEYLMMFKKLQISKEELSDKIGGNLHASNENPVTISNTDVVDVLNAFRNGKITLEQLLDWVNTVWFTELFEYDDEHSDSIASVLNRLEDLDEANGELAEAEIDKYIAALLDNKEV